MNCDVREDISAVNCCSILIRRIGRWCCVWTKKARSSPWNVLGLRNLLAYNCLPSILMEAANKGPGKSQTMRMG
jgi:hypothetical protein